MQGLHQRTELYELCNLTEHYFMIMIMIMIMMIISMLRSH